MKEMTEQDLYKKCAEFESQLTELALQVLDAVNLSEEAGLLDTEPGEQLLLTAIELFQVNGKLRFFNQNKKIVKI